MTHYFFTRVACDARTVNPNYEPLPKDDIARYCDMWIETASKFYECQTASAHFEVVLRFSKMYEDVVRSFDWPPYAELSTDYPHEWIAKNIDAGDPVSFTRVDADDSYSVDFFEFLAGLSGAAMLGRTLMLHKSIRQLGEINGITKPMHHMSPMFSTLLFRGYPKIDDPKIGQRHGPKELLGLIGNHGKFPELPHIEPDDNFALMRITGYNKQNRLGLMGRVWHDVEYETDPKEIARFSYD